MIKILVVIATLLVVVAFASPSFTIAEDSFVKDGKPIQIVSGSLHYFRVPRAYWQDRLQKMKLGGLNAVTTYVAWNVHQPHMGEWNFDDNADLEQFIKEVHAAGLMLLLRPGPFICAEWEAGGFPYWLMGDPAVRVRASNTAYLQHVDRFYDVLMPYVAPYTYAKGGPIVMVQVENEYGSYGDDHSYLEYLLAGFKSRGLSDVVFFASNGANDRALQAGAIPEVLRTINLGGDAQTSMQTLRTYQPTGPLMITEYWDGWFDQWGGPHHTKDPKYDASQIDYVLSQNGSISLYMYHGGTSFGLMAGANIDGGLYKPIVTSYDYDVPLDEAGDVREPNFSLFRSTIGKYMPVPSDPPPAPARKGNYGVVQLQPSQSLFDLAKTVKPVQAAYPQTFEELDVDYGFVLYRSTLTGPAPVMNLTFPQMSDRAYVYLDGVFAGVMWRDNVTSSFFPVSVPAAGMLVEVLVENLGRVNFGPFLGDRKGLLKAPLVDGVMHFGWEMIPLTLDTLTGLGNSEEFMSNGVKLALVNQQPTFYSGQFTATELLDTYLLTPKWTHGIAWVNGFCLGRFWNIGPQMTLFVPATVLVKGTNTVRLLELGQAGSQVVFQTTPVLG